MGELSKRRAKLHQSRKVQCKRRGEGERKGKEERKGELEERGRLERDEIQRSQSALARQEDAVSVDSDMANWVVLLCSILIVA